MPSKVLILGIILLLGSIASPLTVGWNIAQEESRVMSDYDYYYSDNTDSTSRDIQPVSSKEFDDHRIATKQITPYITHQSSPAVGPMDSPWPMLCCGGG